MRGQWFVVQGCSGDVIGIPRTGSWAVKHNTRLQMDCKNVGLTKAMRWGVGA